jgi:hypothetical protein
MRKTLLAALALLLFAQAWAEDVKPAATTGARIAVEPLSFDFGRVLPDKTLTKEFSIRNYGSQDLVIENVSTSCGCTVAELQTKTIKPGKNTPLQVSLTTRAGQQGKMVKSVLIKSNDPGKPTFELKLEAEVVPPTK